MKIEIYMEEFGDVARYNLACIRSKYKQILDKVLGDKVTVETKEVEGGTNGKQLVEIDWCGLAIEEEEKIVYIRLIYKICEMACTQKGFITDKSIRYERFEMECLLKRLGYKTGTAEEERKEIKKNLLVDNRLPEDAEIQMECRHCGEKYYVSNKPGKADISHGCLGE